MGYPTQLGDATTPTGGGSGLVSQVIGWFTGSTANAANAPQVVQDWMRAVQARGNAVVRYPKTDGIGIQGQLTERETTATGYSYYVAPADVLAADANTAALSTLAPITARVSEAGENLGKGLEDPIIKGALVVGGLVVLANVLPALLRKR